MLPEYGRTIQNMVDHCMSLPTRDERTACAHTIVQTMATLFPDTIGDDDTNRTLWDHLAVISGFALDIDWPVDVVQPETMQQSPEHVDYDIIGVQNRQYGATVQNMLDVAASMSDDDERVALVSLVANQMKKTLLAINSDMEADEVVYKDICEMTKGQINVNSETIPLLDFNVIITEPKKKKKKK